MKTSTMVVGGVVAAGLGYALYKLLSPVAEETSSSSGAATAAQQGVMTAEEADWFTDFNNATRPGLAGCSRSNLRALAALSGVRL